MNKKDTVLIVYPIGAYGTFLEWCLNYFSGKLINDDLPFKSNGSSHKFKGFPLDFPGSITTNDYLSSDITYDIARTHWLDTPGSRNNVSTYINSYKDYFKFVIKIHADQDYNLLVLHNILTKVNFEGKNDFIKTLNEVSHIYDYDAVWIKREKLSLIIQYLHSYWNYYETDSANQLTITVSDLITNLKETLKLIFDRLNFKFDPDRLAKIDWVIEHWLALQKYKDIDKLCRNIIESTLNNINYAWSKENLTIYDEAYIQMCLRTLHNTELRCYNLNEFPTDSIDLRKILIHGKSV